MDFEFGGNLKSLPAGSIVQEIDLNENVCSLEKPEKESPGERKEYLHFTLKKNNYNTLGALREIKKRCAISFKRVGFAGTKDRNCISAQRVSIWKGDFNLLKELKLKDVELYDFQYSDEPVTLGDLKGNRFTIPVTDFNTEKLKFIKENGMPNFFGPQRFGSTRLANHLIGKEIVCGNIEAAFRYFLGFPGKEEKDSVRKAREIADRDWGNWKEILNAYPFFMRPERIILHNLTKNPRDFVGGFMKLPKALKKIFIHSYSSWIFNRVLEKMITAGKNLKGKEIPIAGYESNLDGEIGKGVQKVMAADGVKLDDFRIKKIPTLACLGDSRLALIELKDMKVSGNSIEFSLPSGSYATVLLSFIDAKFKKIE